MLYNHKLFLLNSHHRVLCRYRMSFQQMAVISTKSVKKRNKDNSLYGLGQLSLKAFRLNTALRDKGII